MSPPIVTQKRANWISLFLLIGGILVLYATGWVVLGTPLLLGFLLMVRQYLRGRTYDMFITLFVFLGLFFTFQVEANWAVIMPLLFTLGSVYLILREFIVAKRRTGKDAVEDQAQEIMEGSHESD